jgi:DNA-binding response OmpR family regulator
MATPPQVAPRQVSILVLDEDNQNASALRQILDSEGWRVRVVNEARDLLADLRSAEWSLVIANVALLGVESPLFLTLREIATVPVEEGGRLRALFLIPEMTGSQYVGPLESARLPYVVRPYHLHDFLEKVSDLLVEVKAIEAPIRQVRREFGSLRKKKQQTSRVTSMFASRDSYSYTDEEMAEYERQEAEASKTKRQKPRTNLGDPYQR